MRYLQRITAFVFLKSHVHNLAFPNHYIQSSKSKTTTAFIQNFNSNNTRNNILVGNKSIQTLTSLSTNNNYFSFLLRKKHNKTTIATMATMDSPSAERNKDPIWSILSQNVLPKLIEQESKSAPAQKVLEIAAGAGVHTIYFASKMMDSNIHFSWLPTDPDTSCRESIAQRVQEFMLPLQKMKSSPSSVQKYIIHNPISLTLNQNGIVESDDPPEEYLSMHPHHDNNNVGNIDGKHSFDLIICINMIHISPWEATVGLFKVASTILKTGGILYTYGPYKVGGTAVESNLNFDAALKTRDPSWGVRDLEEIIKVANVHGLDLEERIEMPANNMSLIFRKSEKE